MPVLAASGRLFGWIAKGVAKTGLNVLVGGLPLGDLVVNVADEAFDGWQKNRTAKERQRDLEEVARMSADEVRKEIVEELNRLRDESPELDDAELDTIARYLEAVQPAIHNRLRRPDDPTGTTVPADLTMTRSLDLVEILPERPARFSAGDPVPGTTDWTFVELLGVGGFGEVWRCRSEYMGDAAFKFCLENGSVEALRRDAENLARVKSLGRLAGIVELQDVGLNNDPPFVRFEYIDGGELTRLIESWHEGDNKPNPQMVAKLIAHLAKTLAPLHTMECPLVHRDLKPANILVQKKPSGGYVFKIADFGISGLASQSNRTKTMSHSSPRGSYTPLYASPQQMRGEQPDPRDDVYALGVIWYHALTGQMQENVPPDWEQELSEAKIVLPEDQKSLLRSCLASRAERRPDHAGELHRKLSARGSEPVAKPPRESKTRQPASTERLATSDSAPVPQPTNRKTGRFLQKPRWLLIGGSLALVALITIAVNLNFGGDETRLPAGDPITVSNPLGKGDDTGQVRTIPGIDLNLVWCPPGEFRMGSPESEKYRDDKREDQVSVSLTHGFWIGQTEVTEAQWRSVMGSVPDADGDNKPVINVSWDDAMSFCQKLTTAEREAGRLPNDWVYTLPTEAQWEYACRAGTTTAFSFGEDIRSLGKFAWYEDNADGRMPVATKQSNPWGVFDLHGNVSEICRDWYQDELPGGTDPEGVEAARYRVIRGGSFATYFRDLRTARRGVILASDRHTAFGLRVAAVPSSL